MPAVLVRVRARRGEQGVEQHVDIADGEAFVPPYELQRVVGGTRNVRQMAFRELFLVAGHHTERVEQQDVAASRRPAHGSRWKRFVTPFLPPDFHRLSTSELA